MAYTGQLGTSDSMPGNILLGGSTVSDVIAVSSTLTLTQTLIRVIELEAENTLTITSEAIPRSFDEDVDSTLVLDQDVVFGYFKYRSSFANIFFTQTVAREMIYERSVSSTIPLTHELKKVYALDVSNTLTLTQTMVGVNSKYITQTVALSQTVAVQKTINRTLTNTIPLSHNAPLNKTLQFFPTTSLALAQAPTRTKARQEDIEHTLVMTNEAVRLKIFAAASNLASLSHSVDYTRVLSRTVSNTLVPTQLMARNVTYGFNLSSTLVFHHSRTRKIRIGDLTEVSWPDILFSNVRGYQGNCGEQNFKTIVLQAGGMNVILPRPELGDREAGTSAFTMSRSMTGVKRTTVKRSDTQVLNWTFDVRYDKFLELEQFFYVMNTKAFIIDDHKGRLWVGKLLSNPISFSDALEPTRCRSKVTFALDFEALRLH